MDSFYDAPRPPPVPTVLNKVIPTALIPEVSMICQENAASMRINGPNDQNCYKASRWNYNNMQFQLPRKQVRFESPNISQQRPEYASTAVTTNKENIPHHSIKTNFNLDGKSFKQIYMANIPNRHLDLSILEPAKAQQPPKDPSGVNETDQNAYQEPTPNSKVPNNYSEWKQSVKDKHNIDLPKQAGRPYLHTTASNLHKAENYGASLQHRDTYNKYLRSIENCHSKPQTHDLTVEQWTDNKCTKQSESDSTLKELLEIVKLQNQQIMLLQQQVTTLTNCIQYPKAEELQPPSNVSDRNYVDSPCKDSYRYPFLRGRANSPKCAIPKTFSIDLKATSFEVSFRPQINKHKKNEVFEPKIQEITESNDSKNDDISNNERVGGNQNDLSLHLQDSLEVRQACPSPPPSIRISMGSMEDYETSSSDEGSSEGGATFYQDIMQQVNNILENVQIESAVTSGGCKSRAKNKITDQTVNEVKDATVKYLKGLGVNLPPGSAMLDSNNALEYSPSEVSFAVKQLLLKYLPDDHLAKIAYKQNRKRDGADNIPAAAIPSEFSIGTLQYMKKYNLLKKGKKSDTRETAQPLTSGDKILNISTLKLQPKLL